MSIDPETSIDHNPGAWALKVDGSSTNKRSRAGLILKSPDGFTIQTAISFGFSATNNQAESKFKSYLQERGIKHRKSSVAYPQGNGQVEVTNRILVQGIEKRLRESKTKWPEELPNMLWAYRTSPRTSTGEIPFKLAYGTEAMLPIEVGSPSHRAINFDEIANEEGLRTDIELIDEVRDQAIARMEKYKEKTEEHFSKKSRVKNFQVRDLVLQDTEASDSTNIGKLMPKWEGPYKIKEVLRPGTYKLMNMDESEIL
ncbi:uncharacterized protein LOC141673412 [Apium graveolens]|uniref:uncharacterized protein LOC141673412 n=1 Tax=Apium graveolens TaxID=4045 RepID=UPI003D7B6C21